MIFAKPSCIYCIRAKAVLDTLDLKDGAYEYVDISERNDVHLYLLELTGITSVPYVFIGGRFFGGGDDTLIAWKNGSLEEILKKEGAFGKCCFNVLKNAFFRKIGSNL